MYGIVVDAGKLRLIVGPVRCVEEDVVGMPWHLVKTGRIAVNNAHVRGWIGSVIRLSEDRGVGHHVADAILNQIRRNQSIVQARDARSYEVRRIEVCQLNRFDAVARIRIQVLAGAVCHILVCQDVQIDGVHLWSVRVTSRVRFMQAVQGVWVIVGVTNPVEVLLVVLNVSG